MNLTDNVRTLIEKYGEEEVIATLMKEVKKANITVTYEDLDDIYSGWSRAE